jgi:hypothetical protein
MNPRRGFHENTSHHTCRHRQEMGAVLPLHLLHVDEPEIGLVDQGGGLQRVTTSFEAHVTARDTVRLVVDERNQLVERRLVAAAPCKEQGGRVPGSVS